MRKPSTTEVQLAELRELREAPKSPALSKELQKHLSGKTNLVVAKAAQIAGRVGEDGLAADLVRAFGRFMINPAQTDKGCIAKTEIVKALCALECEPEELFLKGVRHVQLEPALWWPCRYGLRAAQHQRHGVGSDRLCPGPHRTCHPNDR